MGSASQKPEDFEPRQEAIDHGVRVWLAERDDGGLRVWSDDEPGLILSGADPARVGADIWPAIKVLRAHRRHALYVEAASRGEDIGPDPEFIAALERGDHLNDDFLSGCDPAEKGVNSPSDEGASAATSVADEPNTSSLLARVAELEGALRPFAEALGEQNVSPSVPDHIHAALGITIGQFRRARSALIGEE